ncbi:MAG TPA: DedA family protein [Candidatus Paceibacterota bacterium]|jgi:membrane-associated protein|nr:DedA family protein [Candidatus Paceibacterota bacterium]
MPHFALMPLVQSIGYPGLFAVIFLESGIFFGFFLPGSSLLFTAGLLATRGIFNPWVLIFLMWLAAVLGDSAGYWFGNKVGVRLFLRESSTWFRHDYLEKAKDFYDKHGVQTVFLARFVPIVRTFVPIVAGVVNMRYRIFLIYNVLGALIWAGGVTFLGYYLGEKIPLVQTYLTPIVVVIVIVTCLPLLWEFRKTKEN